MIGLYEGQVHLFISLIVHEGPTHTTARQISTLSQNYNSHQHIFAHASSILFDQLAAGSIPEEFCKFLISPSGLIS